MIINNNNAFIIKIDYKNIDKKYTTVLSTNYKYNIE